MRFLVGYIYLRLNWKWKHKRQVYMLASTDAAHYSDRPVIQTAMKLKGVWRWYIPILFCSDICVKMFSTISNVRYVSLFLKMENTNCKSDPDNTTFIMKCCTYIICIKADKWKPKFYPSIHIYLHNIAVNCVMWLTKLIKLSFRTIGMHIYVFAKCKQDCVMLQVVLCYRNL